MSVQSKDLPNKDLPLAIDLIRSHYESNDFDERVDALAQKLYDEGRDELADYIRCLKSKNTSLAWEPM